MQGGEVDDASGGLAEIAHAMSDAGRDHEQTGGAVAEHDALAGVLRARAVAHVEQYHQHAVRRRHEPHVGLARVQVERLDGAGRYPAVVDLAPRELAHARPTALAHPPPPRL